MNKLFLMLALIMVIGSFSRAQDAPAVEKKAVSITSEKTSVSDQESTKTLTETPEKWLQRLERAFAETKTVTGEFEQTLVNQIFSDVIEARGDFFFAKERQFRSNHFIKEDDNWIKDNEMIISDDILWLYSPSIEQAEKVNFQSGGNNEAAKLHQMFLGFGPKTEEVLEAYDVRIKESTKKYLTLKFIPLIGDISSEIEYVEITFDKEQLLPRVIVWLTPDQDKTTIEMKNIKKNAKLPKDTFKPDFPKKTTIIER